MSILLKTGNELLDFVNIIENITDEKLRKEFNNNAKSYFLEFLNKFPNEVILFQRVYDRFVEGKIDINSILLDEIKKRFANDFFNNELTSFLEFFLSNMKNEDFLSLIDGMGSAKTKTLFHLLNTKDLNVFKKTISVFDIFTEIKPDFYYFNIIYNTNNINYLLENNLMPFDKIEKTNFGLVSSFYYLFSKTKNLNKNLIFDLISFYMDKNIKMTSNENQKYYLADVLIKMGNDNTIASVFEYEKINLEIKDKNSNSVLNKMLFNKKFEQLNAYFKNTGKKQKKMVNMLQNWHPINYLFRFSDSGLGKRQINFLNNKILDNTDFNFKDAKGSNLLFNVFLYSLKNGTDLNFSMEKFKNKESYSNGDITFQDVINVGVLDIFKEKLGDFFQQRIDEKNQDGISFYNLFYLYLSKSLYKGNKNDFDSLLNNGCKTKYFSVKAIKDLTNKELIALFKDMLSLSKEIPLSKNVQGEIRLLSAFLTLVDFLQLEILERKIESKEVEKYIKGLSDYLDKVEKSLISSKSIVEKSKTINKKVLLSFCFVKKSKEKNLKI